MAPDGSALRPPEHIIFECRRKVYWGFTKSAEGRPFFHLLFELVERKGLRIVWTSFQTKMDGGAEILYLF